MSHHIITKLDRAADRQRMHRFLKACINAEKPIKAIMDDEGVSMETLKRWRKLKPFREAMHEISVFHTEFVQDNVNFGGVIGARRLAEISYAAQATIKPQQRLVLNEAVKRVLDPPGKRGRKAKRKSGGGGRPKRVHHPGLSKEEANRIRDDLEWAKRMTRSRTRRSELDSD